MGAKKGVKKGLNLVLAGYADLLDMVGGLIKWDVPGQLEKINKRHNRIKELNKNISNKNNKKTSK